MNHQLVLILVLVLVLGGGGWTYYRGPGPDGSGPAWHGGGIVYLLLTVLLIVYLLRALGV
jgi:hypothetical protein